VVLYVISAAAPLILRLIGRFPENGSPALLPILMSSTVLSAMLAVAGAILSASMMSDVVEDAQTRTGERSEGLFFAGSFFMQKCVSGFGLFLSGALLSAVHFPAHAVPGQVPAPVMHHLILTYTALTATLGLIAAAVLSRFPLTEADHHRRLAELAEVASHAAPLPGSEVEYPAELSPEVSAPAGRPA
jgi:GPH family glycoside/pentoside/hexuronide:cation symporter